MFFKKKLSYFIFSILTILIITTGNTPYVHAEDKINPKIDIQVKSSTNSTSVSEKWRIVNTGKKTLTRKLNINNDNIRNFNAKQIFPEEINLDYKINDDSSIVIELPSNLNQEIVLEISYTLNEKIANKNIESKLDKILFSKEQATPISLLNLDITLNNKTNSTQYKNTQLNKVGFTVSKNTNDKVIKDNKQTDPDKNSDKNFFKDLISYILEFIVISIFAVIALILSLIGIEFLKHKSRQRKRSFKLNRNNFNTKNKQFKKKNTKFKK